MLFAIAGSMSSMEPSYLRTFVPLGRPPAPLWQATSLSSAMFHMDSAAAKATDAASTAPQVSGSMRQEEAAAVRALEAAASAPLAAAYASHSEKQELMSMKFCVTTSARAWSERR